MDWRVTHSLDSLGDLFCIIGATWGLWVGYQNWIYFSDRPQVTLCSRVLEVFTYFSAVVTKSSDKEKRMVMSSGSDCNGRLETADRTEPSCAAVWLETIVAIISTQMMQKKKRNVLEFSWSQCISLVGSVRTLLHEQDQTVPYVRVSFHHSKQVNIWKNPTWEVDCSAGRPMSGLQGRVVTVDLAGGGTPRASVAGKTVLGTLLNRFGY